MLLILFPMLLLSTSLLFVSIDYALDNKISYTISEYIYNKLRNKNSTNINQTSDIDKENCYTNPNKEYYGKASLEFARLVEKRMNVFSVSIPINTLVNILDMAGLDKYRWIVDNTIDFELNICNQKVDVSNFCNIGSTRTIVFFIGENNKFSLGVNFDSGETIIRTSSKEFESEFATLVFGAKNLKDPNPNNKEYYSKASFELARQARIKLEESENNKIGDNDV